jgi:hypothetical protein
MSFAATAQQVFWRTKTVTRRKGWKDLQPGALLQPFLKAQGLKAGEHVEPIGGPIRVVSVSQTVLGDITPQDVHREGFPAMTVDEFLRMFRAINPGSRRTDRVTRIQFEYVDAE